MFCLQNKDIVSEFVKTVEKTINNTNDAKELKRVKREISSCEKKIVDMRIDELIDKGTYVIKFTELSTALEKLKAEKVDLEASNEKNVDIKKRLNSFRKVFDNNKPIKEFDRVVFESAVNKIILGGTDEEGNTDLYVNFHI
ncbi:hypothetical protein [Abyssisolibacter fermentans]|uniref:hypothetical protein n=1 Tax=Abyssisolibacter fermentans TaxID=1766203 RepID=UPI0008306618|nr:hypothetical protein [Abyssisolibacter fermentans]